MNLRRVNRDVIKYLAIIAMTFNHIAHVLLTPGTALTETFEDIGYFTAITMCYFLVEGYGYTRSKKRYALRLLVFALISEVPFVLACGFYQLDVIFTFLLCFLVLLALEKVKNPVLRWLAVIALTACSILCDWALLLPITTVLFFYARGERKKVALSYAVMILLFGAINSWSFAMDEMALPTAILHGALSTLGLVVSAVMILFFYNGKKAARFQTLNKWFFYIYYPAHLLVLWAIKTFLI